MLPAWFSLKFYWMNVSFFLYAGVLTMSVPIPLSSQKRSQSHEVKVMGSYKSPCKYQHSYSPLWKTSKTTEVLNHLSCPILLCSIFTVADVFFDPFVIV